MPYRTAARVLLAPIRYLSVAFRLPGYFDADERRLVFVSIFIGALTWAIVFTLKLAVHQASEALFHWVNHAPSVYWLLGPLILGAIVVATIARLGASSIHYRDDRGHIHELIGVEGDGLELRTRYGVNAVGKVERAPDGTRIQPHVAVTDLLRAGDLLVVLGEDQKLDALEIRLANTEIFQAIELA